eukprot:TRINITY_DN4944_c0_g1_i11.p1 TRINITY_DN4944_c0_g1~~TRINITY_DN4944_c0_g1_i11.p1  ORF type:complete len:551 (-),score=114.55 TRINITY_DN4944_c0_g1_i11:284-1816(-)
MVEWENPVDHVSYQDRNRNILAHEFDAFEDRLTISSQKQSFRDWLKGSRYTTLGENTSSKKVLVIEDFPSLAITGPSEFQEILMSYAKRKQNPPLVLICSDDSSSRDSLLRTVFKSEFLSQLGIENITFNSATTTNLVKLLTRIGTEARGRDASVRVPDKSALESLCEATGGDIRAAINSLQFTCLNPSAGSVDYSSLFQSHQQNSSASKSKTKKSAKSTSRSKISSQSSVGCKDKTLDMFHALGKILYSKRQDVKESGYLPIHLEPMRRRVLEANPDEVFGLTCLSEEAFACFLHHNYPLFYSDIHETADMLANLSTADSLLQEWSATSGRMDVKEYGVSLVSRSIMFHNQTPSTVQGMRKLTKPEFYSINRKTESNKERLETVMTALHRCYTKKELSTVVIPGVSKLNRKPPGLRALLDLGTFPISSKYSTASSSSNNKGAAAGAADESKAKKPAKSEEEDFFLSEDDDFFEEFIEDLEFSEQSQNGQNKKDAASDSEDYVIEEYDSD